MAALAQNLRLDADVEPIKALQIQGDYAKARNKIAKILAWARETQADAEFQSKVDDLEKQLSADGKPTHNVKTLDPEVRAALLHGFNTGQIRVTVSH